MQNEGSVREADRALKLADMKRVMRQHLVFNNNSGDGTRPNRRLTAKSDLIARKLTRNRRISVDLFTLGNSAAIFNIK